ncbi:MAG: KH domain-containing protein [Clostridium sp.]|nr:KH domain-containing protein [Clostridium sp.]MCM1444335.1 KH domain-containing protein [Candidatus Amulumruptor caecigallinarius]
MNFAELTEMLIKNLVKNPDSVSVKQFDMDEDFITVEVLVNEDDMGVVIGKNGATAKSIRTIVQAVSYAKNSKKVRINIDSI